jgi:hypothetical protein
MNQLRSLVVCSSLLAVLLCNACSSQQVVRNFTENFYESYPDLRSKTKSLSAHVESSAFREVIRYYRLEIEPQDAESFLFQEGYIKIQQLPVATDERVIYCDGKFIKMKGENQSYRKWWDVKSSEYISCYTFSPDHPLREKRAIYDRQRKVLYLHSYFAG